MTTSPTPKCGASAPAKPNDTNPLTSVAIQNVAGSRLGASPAGTGLDQKDFAAPKLTPVQAAGPARVDLAKPHQPSQAGQLVRQGAEESDHV